MNKQQYESNKSILLAAVDTATHVDNEGDYWNMGNDHESSFFDKRDSVWEFCDPQEPLRKLSDIKTLCAQYERIAELEKELAKTKQSQKSGWLRDSNTHVNKLKEQGE